MKLTKLEQKIYAKEKDWHDWDKENSIYCPEDHSPEGAAYEYILYLRSKAKKLNTTVDRMVKSGVLRVAQEVLYDA